MARATWDEVGEKRYELGVDHGMLYVMQALAYAAGVPWNGLTAVNETPSGAESNKNYADNIEYANILSAEEFGATIEAFTAPDEFRPCDGFSQPAKGVFIGQQNREKFGFCYRTKLGNDTEGQDLGYQIHIIYGAQASPSERNRSTVNENPELMTLSWEVTTTPVPVPGFRPTSHLILDSTILSAEDMKKIEDILYGTDDETMPPAEEGGDPIVIDGADPRLPMPKEIIDLLGAALVQG